MKTIVIDSKNTEGLNNLYRPTSNLKLEVFDLVEARNVFNKENKRFLPIMLKEWFALLKKGGELEIFYHPKDSGFSPLELEQTLWWLFERDYSIEQSEYGKNQAGIRIVKNVSLLIKYDGIDQWTFGMVTNGQRIDFIEKSIESIRNLKIPNYEIIICGTYPGKKGGDIKYIEFKERDGKGWITRKKNLIAQNALYPNLCIFHDRIVFDKNWYNGMKKFGNNFEILSCVQKLSDGTRAGDWLSLNTKFTDPGFMYKMEELDYRDWDKYVYVSGQLMIMKKYVWEEVPWNETIYWKQAEDIEYSSRLTAKGYLSRFNSFSSCLSLSWRFGKLPKRQFGNKIPSLFFYFQNVPVRRTARLIAYFLTKIPKVSFLIRFFYPVVARNFLYRAMVEH